MCVCVCVCVCVLCVCAFVRVCVSVCERVRWLVGHFSNRIRKERYLQSPVTCVIYILRGTQARHFSVCVACVCSPASQVHTHMASLPEQLHVQRHYTPSLRHLVHRAVYPSRYGACVPLAGVEAIVVRIR